MFICSDRKPDTCLAEVPCSHARPHHNDTKCSHKRFRCKKFPAKQHRCKKFKPERSDFTCVRNFDTFIVTGIILDRELLRLMAQYGTCAKGHTVTQQRVALPVWLFEAFVAGMI